MSRPKKITPKAPKKKKPAQVRLPSLQVNWETALEKVGLLIQDAVAPYAAQLLDAVRRVNMPKCPTCRRPQSPDDVTWAEDKLPTIKCPCGYTGEAVA